MREVYEAYCDMWRLGYDFSSRASINAYWEAMACNIVVSLVLSVATILSGPLQILFLILLVGYELLVIVPVLAITVRRLHDSDHSGAWTLLLFVPLASLVLLAFLCMDGTQETSRYGYRVGNLPDDGMPEKTDKAFRNTWIGPICLLSLFSQVILQFLSSSGAIGVSWGSFFSVFPVIAILGFSVVLSTRAKGLDISAVFLMFVTQFVMISAQTGRESSIWPGFLLAVLVALGVGLVNGLCIATLSVRAPLITLVTGLIAYEIAQALAQKDIFIAKGLTGMSGFHWVFVVVALIATVILLRFTKTGTQLWERKQELDRRSCVLTYMLSSVLSAIAGLCLIMKTGVMTFQFPTFWILTVMFLAAFTYMSCAWDNRALRVPISLLCALYWNTLYITFVWRGIYTETQQLCEAILVVTVWAVTWIVQVQNRRTNKLAVQASPIERMRYSLRGKQ